MESKGQRKLGDFGSGQPGGREPTHARGLCPFSSLFPVGSHFPAYFLSIGAGRRAPGSSGISLMDSLSLLPICPLPLFLETGASEPELEAECLAGHRLRLSGCLFLPYPGDSYTHFPISSSQSSILSSCLARAFKRRLCLGHFCQASHGFLSVLNHSGACNHKTSFLLVRNFPFFPGYIAYS